MADEKENPNLTPRSYQIKRVQDGEYELISGRSLKSVAIMVALTGAMVDFMRYMEEKEEQKSSASDAKVTAG